MFDEIDIRLILELQSDARAKNVEVAAKLGISEAGVRKRIRKLVESGVVKFQAIPDLSKFGYHNTAFIGIIVEQGQIDTVADKLANHPDVHFVGIMTGQYDILIWVARHSAGDLAKFLKEDLPKMRGIDRTETFVLLEMKKRTSGQLSEKTLASFIENKTESNNGHIGTRKSRLHEPSSNSA